MTDQRLAIELFKRFAAWFWMPKFIHHVLNIILLWQGFRLRSYIMYHHHVISIFWKSFFLFRPFLGNFLVHFAIPFSGDLRTLADHLVGLGLYLRVWRRFGGLRRSTCPPENVPWLWRWISAPWISSSMFPYQNL